MFHRGYAMIDSIYGSVYISFSKSENIFQPPFFVMKQPFQLKFIISLRTLILP